MASQLLALSLGVKIVMLSLFLLVASALIFLLFCGIRRDRKRLKYARNRLKDLKREQFSALIKELLEGEKHKPFSVIFVQVNAAKEYRDNFGEDCYAWALGAIRARISAALPRGSKVCLYEYDTYAFLFEGEHSVEDLNEYLAKCIVQARSPISYKRKMKASPDLILGAAEIHAEDQVTADELLRNVEVALAVSGRGGSNDYAVYTPELLKANADYHYYRELKDAINADEFTLCFQPIRNLLNGDAIAYEAMLRWNHSELGALRPDKFISVLERTGDMKWVGLWAYEQMILSYKKFLKAHPDSKIIFSINLTLRQLAEPDICNELFQINTKYSVPTYRICLEVAEAAILGRDLQVRENIEKLSQCGFLLAIDNMIVDESTVTMLGLRKSFNWVKLDKRFTATVQEGAPDIKDMQQLLELSRNENIAVIAQDIKDGITEEFIKRIGIFCGQGSCLGKAEPIEKYLVPSEAVVSIKRVERKEEPTAEPKD